jgi:copper homeostasis protein
VSPPDSPTSDTDPVQRLLEICCYSVEDARRAQAAGADRIELCAGRPEGGTTPSIGVLERASSAIQIPVLPMVRPRGGDFCYGPDEFAAMRRDVEAIAELGFPGLVLGILRPDATVDVERTTELINLARSVNPEVSITFHRAFDSARSSLTSYADVAATGADRLLTSGQQPTAPEGADLIGELIALQERGPIVMPGSGVRPGNVRTFLNLGALEVHSTATSSSDAPLDPAAVEALADIVHGYRETGSRS